VSEGFAVDLFAQMQSQPQILRYAQDDTTGDGE
jgi:hypothetical protein